MVEFLAALYPDRDHEEFEAGLARLPCMVTHDADETAARELERALIVRGARTRMTPVDEVDLTLRDDDDDRAGTSQEVDVAFLSRSQPRSARAASRSSRARRADDEEIAPDYARDSATAPWEDK